MHTAHVWDAYTTDIRAQAGRRPNFCLGTRCYRASVAGQSNGESNLEVRWLGRIAYREAWDLQHELVAKRRTNEIPDQLLLLEHPPVLTLGRQSDPAHVRASQEELTSRGIEVIRVERGGDVTYHGPGQLVAYPIVRLAERDLLPRPFVRALENAMIDTGAGFGVQAGRRDGYPGGWCDGDSPTPRHLGAMGLRVEGGVTYHGIALNITTDLEDFDLIDPCGLADVEVTSIAREADWPAADSRPSTASVAKAADRFAVDFAEWLGQAKQAEQSAERTAEARARVTVPSG